MPDTRGRGSSRVGWVDRHGRGGRAAPHIATAAAVAIALVGCGLKGDPMPPLIRVADATRDLAVFQEGSEAVLTWSYPSLTTAGGPLPDVEAVELWRATIPAGQEPPSIPGRDRETRHQLLEAQGDMLASLDTAAIDLATRGALLEFRDDLLEWNRRYGREERWVVWYAVRTICCRGRPSEFSNIARLVPQLPPPPPGGLKAAPVAVGITLTWIPQQGSATIVERAVAGGEWQVVTAEPVAGASWQDRTAEQGGSYGYRLRAVRTLVDGGRIVGGAGQSVTVSYPDVYPPSVPANLVCLPEEALVQVRWDASADAAFYVVSRRTDGGWQELAARLRESQFEDATPPLGSVTYSVRAADAAGNLSEPASCTTVIGAPP